MSRYADVDALMQSIRHRLGIASLDNLLESEKAIVKEIDSAPSIDIVFCRECKYAHMTYGGECKYCDMWKDEDDNYMELYLDGDYYCASGERRDDENVDVL